MRSTVTAALPRVRVSTGLRPALAGLVLLFGALPGHAAPPPEGFADVVERVKPAVVNIAVVQKAAGRSAGQGPGIEIPPELRGTPLEELLKRFLQRPGESNDDGARSSRVVSVGSGFIIGASGLVVTANHVIQDAEQILATLADGRKLGASVVGRDKETDVALLQLDAKETFPFVSWGDSAKVRVGDWVLAVGNPFGLGGTVTAGILSARGRDIQSGRFDDFLQIDAPINRGNSGGPLFDRNGLVIGINTAIYSPTGGSVGIGFAIPSSVARPIVAELQARGRVDRAWLGVSAQPVSKAIADSLGLPDEKGAMVLEVVPGSPAMAAGLQQGDIIRSLDGRDIVESRDLARSVVAAGPGKRVKLRIWRDGKEIAATATLGMMPSDEAPAAEAVKPEPKRPPARAVVLGLTLAPINRDTRELFDLPEDAAGVVVAAVKAGSAGDTAGFEIGDLIVKAGSRPVATPQDVLDAVVAARKSERRTVLFLIVRQGQQRFVGVPVPRG
ncbi:MAG: Do family serine endopeptidase [Alphaproteobacteria bacterium]|nr:Do family serine endopeptidase [Alphaproteobacteria bacterium]